EPWARKAKEVSATPPGDGPARRLIITWHDSYHDHWLPPPGKRAAPRRGPRRRLSAPHAEAQARGRHLQLAVAQGGGVQRVLGDRVAREFGDVAHLGPGNSARDQTPLELVRIDVRDRLAQATLELGRVLGSHEARPAVQR